MQNHFLICTCLYYLPYCDEYRSIGLRCKHCPCTRPAVCGYGQRGVSADGGGGGDVFPDAEAATAEWRRATDRGSAVPAAG